MDVDVDVDIDRRRLNRRQILARGVAAGATAWVAPVIIDSLASPAGAVTVATGCFDLFYPRSGSSGSCTATTPSTFCCQPAGFGTHASFITTAPGCVPTVSGNCGSDTSTTSFTIPASCNCVFIQGRMYTGGSNCLAGTISGLGKTITWTNVSMCDDVSGPEGFRMLVACGGSTACSTSVTNTCDECDD